MLPIQYAIQVLQALAIISQLGQDIVPLVEQAVAKLKRFLETGEPPTGEDMAKLDALIAQNSQALRDAAKP
jgi:hypothetical protein